MTVEKSTDKNYPFTIKGDWGVTRCIALSMI